MAPDAAAADSRPDCEAMGSVDSDQYIIANPCRDDAWVSVSLDGANTLSEWR